MGAVAVGAAEEGEVVLVCLASCKQHSNSPTSSRGLPHILRWLPILNTSRWYRCMSMA